MRNFPFQSLHLLVCICLLTLIGCQTQSFSIFSKPAPKSFVMLPESFIPFSVSEPPQSLNDTVWLLYTANGERLEDMPLISGIQARLYFQDNSLRATNGCNSIEFMSNDMTTITLLACSLIVDIGTENERSVSLRNVMPPIASYLNSAQWYTMSEAGNLLLYEQNWQQGPILEYRLEN